MAEVNHAKRSGYFEQGRNNGQAVERNCSGYLPGVQPDTAKQDGPVPVCDVHFGRRGLEMLALRFQRRFVL